MRHLKPALVTAFIALIVVLLVTWWHTGDNYLRAQKLTVAN